MNEIEKVNDFLGQAQTFYLTTVDGDRPKCRPVAFHMISGDRVYFGIGDFKEVYKQMQKNPHVEICVVVGKEFLRYYGTAVFEKDHTIAERVLAAAPPCRRSIMSRPDISWRFFIWKTQPQSSEGCWG